MALSSVENVECETEDLQTDGVVYNLEGLKAVAGTLEPSWCGIWNRFGYNDSFDCEWL